MDGQRLTLVSGSYGVDGSQYRTENEGFSKIVEHNDINDSDVYFEVWTKSGQHMEFGNTVDSRVLTVGLTTNVARAWAVNKISDTVGNYLTVTYNCAESGGSCTDASRVTYGQAYPLQIDYTGHSGSPTLSPYNSVRFSYCSRDVTPVCARDDSVPMYQAGALMQNTVILWDIKTYQGSNLVYDYQLDYDRGTTLKHSRITSVKLCGTSTCLAPTSFDWQGGEGYLTISAGTTETVSQDATIVPGDYDADGVTDVLVLPPGTCQTSYSAYSGPSWTTTAGSVANPDSTGIGCSFTAAQQTLVAPNGNSNVLIQERVEYSPPPDHYYAIVSNTAGEVQGSFGISLTAPVPVLAGDFNGDGLTDAFKQGVPSSIYYGQGGGGFPDRGRKFPVRKRDAS